MTLSLRFAVPYTLLLALTALAQQGNGPAALTVPVVSLRDKLPLRQALREVRKQTGVTVADLLRDQEPDISLDLEKVSFWQAVDVIAVASNTKAVQSGRDGSITLRPLATEDRRAPVSYDGPFCIRVARITTSRDLDSARGSCVVGLDVTWTPTLRPLFLDSLVRKVRLRDTDGKDVSVADEGSALVPVDGRFSLPLELTLPAPPRRHATIASLEGSLVAVAPSKMSRFSFDADLAALNDAALDGDQRKVVQDGVSCRVGKIVLGREAWSVQVALDYPEGNRPFESFQAGSIALNNDLILSHKDGRRQLSPTGSVVEQAGSRRVVVTYHFADRQGAQRGRAADWKAVYIAPARVIEVPFRFSFKDLPLP